MSRSVTGEVEHRRGLVLGFTLAEVLLLLLFLLLLALSAQIVELRDRLDATPDQDKAERLRLETMLERVRPLVVEAEEINPNDPPEALRRGLEFIRRFGTETSPDALHVTQPQVSNVVDEAARLDPKNPPEVLIKRSLEIIKKVGLDTPIEQINRDVPGVAAMLADAKGVNPQDPTGALRKALSNLKSTAALPKPSDPINTSATGKHDWPPIINLSEADGYFFESGSAELSHAFRETISHTVVERLLDIVRQYDVNVIEVVGHTDEQPLSGKPSNLDKVLFPFLRGQTSEKFTPSDNAGLGLARAVAVLRFLREDARLNDLRIIPLSGAQLVSLGDRLATGDPSAMKERRRIEIRVRRSDRVPSRAIEVAPVQWLASPSWVKPGETAKPQDKPVVNFGPSAVERTEARRHLPTKPAKPSCFAIDKWPNGCP